MTATRPPRGSVFLVEDEVMIRMMGSDRLEELGYSVAAEAGEIGDLAECLSPAGDLRTLPFHLQGASPRLSGLDGFFAARLRRRD